MMKYTHADSVNWRSSGGLGDFGEPRDEIAGALTRMDGAKFWGYAVWRIPEGQTWGEIDLGVWPKEFLQSAGDRDRMSIELRRIEDDGQERQYAVGRPGTTHEGEPSESVTWSVEHELSAYPGEVYTAEQAAPVYLAYYETGDVPAGYVLRDLESDASE